MGWSDLSNGDLIAAAEAAKFELFVTADRNIRYQQRLGQRSIGIIVLPTNRWTELEPHLPAIAAVIDGAKSGCFVELDLPRAPLRRRPPPVRS